MKRVIKEIVSWSLVIVISFFLSGLINTKVFAKVKVKQSSMENTLHESEQLIVDKVSYNFNSPKRGDIIIFLDGYEKKGFIDSALVFIKDINPVSKDENNRLVKRVIGIPGDEINIKDGHVYVNNEKINESYAKGETLSENTNFPMVVGENELFVLGDNREVSLDSREFGTISYNQVEGKAVFRIFPFDEMGKIK